jgi:hypothetical protein
MFIADLAGTGSVPDKRGIGGRLIFSFLAVLRSRKIVSRRPLLLAQPVSPPGHLSSQRIRAVHEQVQAFGHVLDELVKQLARGAVAMFRALGPKQPNVGSKAAQSLVFRIAPTHE